MKKIKTYCHDQATEMIEKYSFLTGKTFRYGDWNFIVHIHSIFIESVTDYRQRNYTDIKRLWDDYYSDDENYVILVAYHLSRNHERLMFKEILLLSDLEEHLGYEFVAPFNEACYSYLNRPELKRKGIFELAEFEYVGGFPDLFFVFGTLKSSPFTFFRIMSIYDTTLYDFIKESPELTEKYIGVDTENTLVDVVQYQLLEITPNGLLESYYQCLVEDFEINSIKEIVSLYKKFDEDYLQSKQNVEFEKLAISTPTDCDYGDIRMRTVDCESIRNNNIEYKDKDRVGHIDIIMSRGGRNHKDPSPMMFKIRHSETQIEEEISGVELLNIVDENSLIKMGKLEFCQYMGLRKVLEISEAFKIYREKKSGNEI